MSKMVSEEEKHIVFSVTMPKNVVRQIDRRRGFMPRSAWLKTLAINELKRLNGVPAHTASRTVFDEASEIIPAMTGDDSSNG